MSSTTDPEQPKTPTRERGQTLVLFALSITVLLGIAALAFDVGQTMLDKRAQQNAADAAALAGARYIAGSGCESNPSLANTACDPAVAAALEVARLNGYGDGATNCTSNCFGVGRSVTVKIPPGPEAVEYYNAPGAIEVIVDSHRGSLFSGILGFTNWNVSSMATAANQIDIALGFSFLALDPNCPSVTLTGASGSGLTAGGSVQVDATCPGGLKIQGNAQITVTSGACNVSGTSIQTGGNATVNCTVNTNVPVMPDPLADLPAPSIPPLASPPTSLDSPAVSPPANCPSTLAAPATCKFSASYQGTRWRLYPGTYPGGLQLNAGTFYLEPGIYYFAGGGFSAGGNGVEVDSVDTGTTTPGGGVLFYNTSDTAAGSPCAGAACGGPITLNGSGAVINLEPYQSDPYKGMVIFQDRTLNSTVTLNGSSSGLKVSGTIYAPDALVQINGSNSTAMNTQVIAYDFKFNGSGGSMNVGYDANSFFHIRGSGLVK